MEDGWQRVRVALQRAARRGVLGCADRNGLGIRGRFRARLSRFANSGRLAPCAQHTKNLGDPARLAHRSLFDFWQPAGKPLSAEGNSRVQSSGTRDDLDPASGRAIQPRANSERRAIRGSIHCPSQRNPVRSAISGISSALYLCELSVQMVSSSFSMNRRLAPERAPFAGAWSAGASRCVVPRCSSAPRAGSSANQNPRPVPRLIRASKFKLNAAVTPAGSS